MITNETWKKVKGFNNFEVSDKGRVRNIKLGLIKSQRKTKTGYMIVDLKENGNKYTRYVHRLVAEAFIKNAFFYECVNHKDENKENNCVENLEWCDIAYNNTYHGRAKKIGEHHKKYHPSCKKVKCVETGVIYDSVRAAGRITGICSICISCCLNGKQKTAGGYHWKVVISDNV